MLEKEEKTIEERERRNVICCICRCHGHLLSLTDAVSSIPGPSAVPAAASTQPSCRGRAFLIPHSVDEKDCILVSSPILYKNSSLINILGMCTELVM